MDHGLLAFAYLATCVAILAPRFFAARWGAVAVAAVAAFAANLLWLRFAWTAVAGISGRLPAAVKPHAALLVGSALVAACAAFLLAAAANAWAMRRDRAFLLMAALTVLLTGTAFGITIRFSSRYVMTAFPFALLMVQPFFTPSRGAAWRLAAGAALGAASLGSYFW